MYLEVFPPHGMSVLSWYPEPDVHVVQKPVPDVPFITILDGVQSAVKVEQNRIHYWITHVHRLTIDKLIGASATLL